MDTPDGRRYGISTARRSRAERRQRALEPLQQALDEAIDKARELLNHTEPGTALRAAHAISQLSSSYVKIYEAVELETRLEALEQQTTNGTHEHYATPGTVGTGTN